MSSAPCDHTPGKSGWAASFFCIPRDVAVFDFPARRSAMKVNVSAHRNWKEDCVDGVLITMVVGSILGFVLMYIHN